MNKLTLSFKELSSKEGDFVEVDANNGFVRILK